MARLDHVTLRGASLQNARFYGATSLAIDFTASQMPHADLSHFQAVGADFSQANLNGALLHAAQLPSALWPDRSEEHTSELQSLMRISYAVFCFKKKKKHQTN